MSVKTKFVRTIFTNFGAFEKDSVHELSDEQYEYLKNLNPDDIEVAKVDATKSVSKDAN